MSSNRTRKPGSQLDMVVEHYRRNGRPGSHTELAYFQGLTNKEEAVSNAALAQVPDVKQTDGVPTKLVKHPHQYRIPRAVLEASCERLLAKLPTLQKARRFDELIGMVGSIIGPIRGVGQLVIYDTAHRIGAHLGHRPERVYLHAGTRVGANMLDLGVGRDTLEMHELPEQLRRLPADEVEDILCIYKDSLLANGPIRGCGPRLLERARRVCR